MNNTVAPLFDLTGTTAVVTGAGRGIGQAVAELFARAGARVAVADIDTTNAANVAEAIRASGGQAVAVTVDVSDEPSVRAMYTTAMTQFGSVDSLVHSAAIFPKYALLEVT